MSSVATYFSHILDGDFKLATLQYQTNVMCVGWLRPDSLRMGDIWRKDFMLQLKLNLYNLSGAGIYWIS